MAKHKNNMMNPARRSYSGFFDGNYYRSYAEWLLAAYLTIVEAKTIKFEPFVFRKKDGGKKIPDIVIYENNLPSQVLEIKTSENETIDSIVQYTNINTKELDVRFITMNRKVQGYYKNKIKNVIGTIQFEKISNDFKSQKTIKGFTKSLNPMYGKKHSARSIQLMSEYAKIHSSGKNNGMYGRTHSDAAKLKISAKWKDPSKKLAMKRKGMITHFSKFDSRQQHEFMKYADNIWNNVSVGHPPFVNNAYFLSKTKILELFESFENFKFELERNIKCS